MKGAKRLGRAMRKMSGKMGTLFEAWELYGYRSLEEWERELRKEICVALLKQGFVIDFGNGIVAETPDDFWKIVKILEEEGIQWWKKEKKTP